MLKYTQQEVENKNKKPTQQGEALGFFLSFFSAFFLPA